ncbi:hypothetical protein O9993_21260 [Vibrio lentus]|nr:hypothetical protein [Vibrio lentus]
MQNKTGVPELGKAGRREVDVQKRWLKGGEALQQGREGQKRIFSFMERLVNAVTNQTQSNSRSIFDRLKSLKLCRAKR